MKVRQPEAKNFGEGKNGEGREGEAREGLYENQAELVLVLEIVRLINPSINRSVSQSVSYFAHFLVPSKSKKIR